MSKKSILISAAAGLLVVFAIGYVLSIIAKPKFAFIETQKIFGEFKLKKELEAKLNGYKKIREKELDSLKLVIRLRAQELKEKNIRQGPLVLDYTRLEQEYYIKERNYQEDHSDQSDQYTQQTWKQLNQYIKEYGVKNNYRYIFGAKGEGDLMYAPEKENITLEVIEFVNQRYDGEINK